LGVGGEQRGELASIMASGVCMDKGVCKSWTVESPILDHLINKKARMGNYVC